MVERYGHLTDAATLGVDVYDVVTRILHIYDGERHGDEYDFLCPAHDDHRPSASINLTSGYWHCLSCGAGGDLLRLTMRTLDVDLSVARDMVRSLTPTALLARLESLRAGLRGVAGAEADRPVPLPYQYARGPLTELEARGFTPKTLRRWSVRYVPSETLVGQEGPFNIYASIGIPVMDETKRVLFWCYRRTDASPHWQPRYLYSATTLLRSAWFGAQHHRSGDIVIVEGALDAMWLDQCGIPALALLGASMGAHKARWLAEHFDTATLLGDYDLAGAHAVARVGALLADTSCTVRVARYWTRMGARDPQELTPRDLHRVVDNSIPWSKYLHRRARRAVENLG